MQKQRDMSCKEVADLMGISVNTLHNRLHQRRKKLERGCDPESLEVKRLAPPFYCITRPRFNPDDYQKWLDEMKSAS